MGWKEEDDVPKQDGLSLVSEKKIKILRNNCVVFMVIVYNLCYPKQVSLTYCVLYTSSSDVGILTGVVI